MSDVDPLRPIPPGSAASRRGRARRVGGRTRSAWVGLALGLGVLVGAYYYGLGPREPLAPQAPPAPTAPLADGDVVEAPEQAMQEPLVQHPVPEPRAGERVSLPPIEESDAAVLGRLRELVGAEPVERFVVPREVVRRFVLLVDSLDREALPLWWRPLRRVPGSFQVLEQDGQVRVAESNATRYEPYVALLEALDTAGAVRLYQRHYPLFQDAYDRLGNPRTRYFNDRLIQVIDHLLQTPRLEATPVLARRKVLYVYADPALEARSSGQKALLRMGPTHAARVQAKLRELRAALLALSPPR